jgi:hypothetical protein
MASHFLSGCEAVTIRLNEAPKGLVRKLSVSSWPDSRRGLPDVFSWPVRTFCRSSKMVSSVLDINARQARGDRSLASAEDRPAFQEVDHLLDSASAPSPAAAVQRSDRQVDRASAYWEDRVRGERLDRGAASLDFRGSRTWAPVLFSNLRCRPLQALKWAGPCEPTRSIRQVRKFRDSCLLRWQFC